MRKSRVAAFHFLATVSGIPNLKRPAAIVATQSFRSQFFYSPKNHCLQHKTNDEMNRNYETWYNVLKEILRYTTKDGIEYCYQHPAHKRKDDATHGKGDQHATMSKPNRKQNAHVKCDHGPA